MARTPPPGANVTRLVTSATPSVSLPASTALRDRKEWLAVDILSVPELRHVQREGGRPTNDLVGDDAVLPGSVRNIRYRMR